MTLNAAIMCPFKQLQIKKQNDIDCIYMTSLCCEFILSLFCCVEPLKKIRGCGWVFLLIGLALSRTTLCACSRSFWGGAENRSSIGLLIWPAHLFRHFLRRVPRVPFTTVHFHHAFPNQHQGRINLKHWIEVFFTNFKDFLTFFLNIQSVLKIYSLKMRRNV